MKRILMIAAVALFATACRVSQFVPVETIKTEYRNIVEYAHDTTIVKDSVWIKERGDTIYIDRWHTRDRIVMTSKVDSFIVRDTIPQITEVKVPVHYRSGYDRFCSWFMWIVIVLVIGAVAWRIARWRLHTD